jgi:two-component system, NarL family, sensor histidine kinase DesK
MLLTVGLLVVQAAETRLLHQPAFDVAIAAVLCLMCCLVTYFSAESWRRNAELKLSHEEIRRLATVAERERIGRDLHDLLGHSLSLIALKSELAGKLIERDRGAAAREIAEVTQVAREALRQVRTAVMGIRSVELAAELRSAQALLASCGIEPSCSRAEVSLPSHIETALALIVREAVTNIQRHSSARQARIELEVLRMRQEWSLSLIIADDGRGGARLRESGSGLAGIAERARALGGSLQVDSMPGRGTTLRVTLPLASVAEPNSSQTTDRAAPEEPESADPAGDSAPALVRNPGA